MDLKSQVRNRDKISEILLDLIQKNDIASFDISHKVDKINGALQMTDPNNYPNLRVGAGSSQATINNAIDLYISTATNSFAELTGDPYDNPALTVALNNKENISNKVSVIVGNESDTIKYPNTKAVSDADILVFNNSKAYTDSKISATYAKIVYVNAVSPTTATIFSLSNPPTVNDNSLKNDVQNLYIGTDSSTWVYQTSPAGYITKTGLGGDMTTNTPQTVTALKTFLNGMFGLRNVANTFTSFFNTAATAARTWTFPDKNGTVAMTSDIVAQLSGTVNRLVKFGTTTTGTNSRITDTGTYIGIDTIFNPIKDLSIGNQNNREIGIEDSESINAGKDLVVSAGRTVNFLLTTTFLPLGDGGQQTCAFSGLNGDVFFQNTANNLTVQNGGVGGLSFYSTPGISGGIFKGGCVTASNNLYVSCGNNGKIYKQTNKTGSFVDQGVAVNSWSSMCTTPSGDVYAAVGKDMAFGGNPGDIYKQTGGTGSFVPMGFPSRHYYIASAPNGDIYAATNGGSIYLISNGTSVLTDLLQTNRNWTSITVAPSGDVYASEYSGDIYKRSGSGNFIAQGQVARTYIGVSVNTNSTLYAATVNSNGSYYINVLALGTPNLDGGTTRIKAGTGKGTGKSRVQIITGQKTVSGTDMQIETVRAEFDENGNANFFGAISQMNQLEVSGAVTATEDMNGKEVTFIGNGSLTIPSTLSAQWNIDLCADGATITWILGGGLTWRVAGIAAGTAPASVTDGQFCQVSRRIGTNEIRVRGI